MIKKKVMLVMILIIICSLIVKSDKIYVFNRVVDNVYCEIGKDCVLNNLVVNNLSVIGSYMNISVLSYNVTNNMEVTGDLSVNGRTHFDNNEPVVYVGYKGYDAPCGAAVCINSTQVGVAGMLISGSTYNLVDMKRTSAGSAQFRLIDVDNNVATMFVNGINAYFRAPNGGSMGLQVGDYAGNVLYVDSSNDTWIPKGSVRIDQDNDGINLGEGQDVMVGLFTGSILKLVRDWWTTDMTRIDIDDADVQVEETLRVLGNSTGVSIWSAGNISAKGYITRTSTYDKSKGDALDYIKDANEYKKEGKIDHKAFYGYTSYELVDYDRPVITEQKETICDMRYSQEEDREINVCEEVKTNITSFPYTKIEEGVNLEEEINMLRQAIYELNNKVAELEKK